MPAISTTVITRALSSRASVGMMVVALVAVMVAPASAKKHPSVDPPSYAEVAKGGAQAILEATDAIHFGYKTQELDGTMEVHSGAGEEGETIRMRLIQDGDKRFIRVFAPPRVKGMGVLLKDASTMYVYMPEFDKVRRVASHARKQTLLGSDFNYDDIAMSSLSPMYEASIVKEGPDEVELLLKVRPGKDMPYPTIRLFIDKKTLQTKREEYYDAEGRHTRTQKREAMKSFDSPDYAVQSVITMIDHTNHDHWTKLTITAFKADHEIPKRVFSKRALVRGD